MFRSSMARKGESLRAINVAVVGLSGTEKDKGQAGVGKSCLCNRFMRSLADDYSVDHISVLSQTDFSGRVVNNDHFLYWGDIVKPTDEGQEVLFQVIEQTEFIDDASFQPFKGGKMEPYMKRCTNTKLTSAEKLMYICKNQLGIEKEYEQKVIPDGKFNVDGFLCLYDVSVVPSRSIEKQTEVVAAILNNIMKTKKPVILVTTKNDDASEIYVKEAEKLVNRKEYKGTIPIVETSAHENINVDNAFIALAQLIDRSKGRMKVVPFIEAARARKEVLDQATEVFQRLIRSQVTDYRAMWNPTSKKLTNQPDFIRFVDQFGMDSAHRLFRRHVKKLKDEYLAERVEGFMEMLPDVLQEMIPDLNTLMDSDWPSVQQHIKDHPDFSQYFYECPDDLPWTEGDFDDPSETRIPFDVLDTTEAETVFKNHVNALQQEQKRLEYKKQFKQLLEDTGYVTPGKLLSEVRVLFMGRECFEALSDHECQAIYDRHQKEIVEKAKHNFQELLLEHADLFYHFKSIAPTGTITQDDIKEITDALQEDSRYKSLDRLDQDRKLMLFQHLGFVHCPIREHCPAFPNCMDALIERILANKAHRPSSWNHSSQWMLSSDNNQLNLVILGIDGLADELVTEIRTQCDDDEYEIDCQLYSLDYRIIDGDVSLPQNSFKTSDFVPHGCFCVYSNPSTFEYVRESLEKTLLSNLEQDDRLPFQGLPIVILFVADPSVEEKEVLRLREEGQSLADSLQCPFIDVTMEDIDLSQRFNANLVADGLRQLILSIHHRAGFINVYQSVMDGSEPDIRIIMCMFCGDPYSVENVLGPLLNHQCCFLSGERSIILETFLGDSKRKVEVIISSYHGANAFRDDLVHGFILVYSTKRKASLATLNAFSLNIPNLPIQIMAVTDTGGANAFFSSDLSHLLMTEGNAVADRLGAHFMTSSSSCQQKTAFYTPFFKEVWDKKPEIEQAFNMEEPPGLSRSAECTLEVRPGRRPRPPPRLESYHCKGGSNDGSGSEIYERLPTDASQGDDINLSPSFNDHLLSPSDDSDIYSHVEMYSQENGESLVKPSDIKNAKMHQGFQVYPPPTTPPEPAPPDHPPRHPHRLVKATTLPSGSHTSLDEITSDISGSRESLATRDSGWVDDSVFLHRTDGDEGMWMNNYAHRAFTTGRRHVPPTKTRPKGNSHTLKQPGKLNMEEYSLVTDAIARMNVKGKESKLVKLQRPVYGHHAPLAREENMDVVSEYAQVKDAVPSLYSSYDGEYTYALVQDAVGNNKSKVRHRREKGRPAFSESDSDWSSLERKQRAAEAYSKANRKPAPHKRVRKKRTAIPVPTPRVPNMQSFAPDGAGMLSYRLKDEKSRGAGDSLERANSESPSDASDASDPDMSAGSAMRPQTKLEKHSFRLKKRTLGPAPRPPVVPNPPSLDNDMFSPSSKMKLEGSYGRIHDDESSLDVSSPRDVNSPLFGMGSKLKDDDKLNRRKEKQRAKDDEKLEKKRQKEVKKLAEKEKEREKKKIQKQQQKQQSVTKQLSAGGSSGVGSGGSGGSGASAPTLQDFVQSDDNSVPLLLEKCVKFIEEEGLDSEGIYRVPGNRAHVDLLFQKFEEDSSVDIHELDIPVNAVATALKDFFSKRLPPLFTEEAMTELEDISELYVTVRGDRSCRLLALRSLLKKMPDVNFEVLKFVFQHFVRVSENCKLNSMDSKNLAICWWPTLLPIEFSDMGRFEAMRPHLEDVVQTMIDQYPFLFCGKEAFVMV
ncbi:rho GTPase-activating protein 190 isoform X2 [Frankliniella occidentalis]|uniref:Rho GTPase-activating protein 190 isoform X2 n=1 Tax=Frankliniella occidentalis TaxID=133901 RepID=A0A6J1S0V3_FRAOC|nr:rho GTPase-activating protein 190 isoform X2 [Frankliniella occidentalis]